MPGAAPGEPVRVVRARVRAVRPHPGSGDGCRAGCAPVASGFPGTQSRKPRPETAFRDHTPQTCGTGPRSFPGVRHGRLLRAEVAQRCSGRGLPGAWTGGERVAL